MGKINEKKETVEEVTDAESASTAKVVKFSELGPKAELVILNTNKAQAIVTKAYWQSVRTNELDRLQKIKLLGVAVRKEGEKGYEIQEIEDDYEIDVA